MGLKRGWAGSATVAACELVPVGRAEKELASSEVAWGGGEGGKTDANYVKNGCCYSSW